MFKVTQIDHLVLPAQIVVAGGQTGKVMIKIKYLGVKANDEFLHDAQFVSLKPDMDIIRELVVDVEGLVDQDDQPIDWATQRDEVLDHIHIFRGIRDALINEMTGKFYATSTIEKN